jgi:ABC-type antimicrobial peptide transport system permease subunit
MASSLFVRFSPGHTPAVTRAIADELRRQDSRASFTFRSFEDLVSATVIRERMTAALSVAFGALALLLAAIGLYGVMSYGVSRRRSEIAVRMALGADRSAIRRLIVGRGSALVAAGILTGVTISWWGSRYLQALLFELDPRDGGTMAGSIVVLCLAGLAAAWFPAKSASRIDPADLLRES